MLSSTTTCSSLIIINFRSHTFALIQIHLTKCVEGKTGQTCTTMRIRRKFVQV